jgi:hypothetical protein
VVEKSPHFSNSGYGCRADVCACIGFSEEHNAKDLSVVQQWDMICSTHVEFGISKYVINYREKNTRVYYLLFGLVRFEALKKVGEPY